MNTLPVTLYPLKRGCTAYKRVSWVWREIVSYEEDPILEIWGMWSTTFIVIIPRPSMTRSSRVSSISQIDV